MVEGHNEPFNISHMTNYSVHDNGTEGGHHGDEHHGVHVISWNLEYVMEPLLVSIFIFTAGALKLGFHYASFLSSIIPESCLLVVTGTIFGAILNAVGLADRFHMDPRLFMLFLLPPIVLDSAYSLNDRVFYEHIGSILMYAVVGTIMNFLFLGPTLYGLAQSGAMGSIDISFVECMLFASFIIAVDPVAVLAIFNEVGVNNVLYFLVFGESLLNDAVTVVVSNMMKVFVDMETIPPKQIALGVISFFTVSFGGLIIGIIYGVFTAIFTKYTSIVRVVEPLAVLIFAYLSYLTAELFHWSGIIAMIGCGLVQAEYSFHNISRKSYVTVKYFVKMVSTANDCIIFLFLGIELVTTKYQWHTGFVLWSMFYCLVFRFLVVFGLTFLMNRFKTSDKTNFEEQFIMWYGGLRGAVCFALCDTIRDDFRHKDMFLTTTFFVILCTVFLMGSTIKPLVQCCNIRRKDDESESMFAELNTKVSDHLMTGIETVIEHKGSNYLRSYLMYMNDHYIRFWLQNDPMKEDEKILACYGKMVMKDYEDVINKTYLHPVDQSQFYMNQDGSEGSSPPLSHPSTQPSSRHSSQLVSREGSDDEGAVLQIIPEGKELPPLPGQDGVPELRKRKFERQHSKREKIAQALKNRFSKGSGASMGSLNFDEPTLRDIKLLLRQGGAASAALHQKYDRNLIHDDDSEYERHLKEKRARLARMRRMTMRTAALHSAPGSPGQLRKGLGSPPSQRRQSAMQPEVNTSFEKPARRHLLSEGDASASSPSLPIIKNESETLSAQKPRKSNATLATQSPVLEIDKDMVIKPRKGHENIDGIEKPRNEKTGVKKDKPKDGSVKMRLLHDQATIGERDGNSDEESPV